MHGESQPNLRGLHRAEAVARPRLPWIDTARVAVTVLVIAHHCAVTYGNIPVWFYNEPPQDPTAYALDALVVLNQTWFMGLFLIRPEFRSYRAAWETGVPKGVSRPA